MLLDKDRRGIQYNYLDNSDKLSRGKEEPQWQQHSKAPPQWQKVLHNNTKMAYTVRLNTTTPSRAGKLGPASRVPHVAQEIEDLSWRRTMELCCKHLDLVEVRAVSQRLPCTVSACAFISPITHEHRIDTAGV